MVSPMGREFLETADCYAPLTQPVELYDLVNDETKLGRFKTQASAHNLTDDIRAMALDAPNWLPFAAEKYNISANIKDYVMIPVPIMPVELPNRNQVGFPFAELSQFNVDSGCLAYQTWKGKPTFYEHQNKDHTKAKGVILATSMRPIPGTHGSLWKVVNLCSFDRSRDPILGNRILTRELSTYSMGAYCRDYQCNVCGSLHSAGGCHHVKLGKPNFKTFSTAEGEVLAYLRALDPLGFETSAVEVPAFHEARNSNYLTL